VAGGSWWIPPNGSTGRARTVGGVLEPSSHGSNGRNERALPRGDERRRSPEKLDDGDDATGDDDGAPNKNENHSYFRAGFFWRSPHPNNCSQHFARLASTSPGYQTIGFNPICLRHTLMTSA
jgi:hypothetical protein